ALLSRFISLKDNGCRRTLRAGTEAAALKMEYAMLLVSQGDWRRAARIAESCGEELQLRLNDQDSNVERWISFRMGLAIGTGGDFDRGMKLLDHFGEGAREHTHEKFVYHVARACVMGAHRKSVVPAWQEAEDALTRAEEYLTGRRHKELLQEMR